MNSIHAKQLRTAPIKGSAAGMVDGGIMSFVERASVSDRNTSSGVGWKEEGMEVVEEEEDDVEVEVEEVVAVSNPAFANSAQIACSLGAPAV